MTEDWLPQTSLHNWTTVIKKNVSTCTVRKRLCEAGLYGRISVKIPLLRKQNNVQRLQSAKVQKDWTIEQWNKVHWTEELKFNIFGLNMSTCGKELVKELQSSVSRQPSSMEEALIWWEGAFANCKVRDLHQVNGKLNQTSYHSILQHHAIPSGTQLVGHGFVLMQDNDPKHSSKVCLSYIKSLEEQHVLRLMSWPVQLGDLNPIELVCDELKQKVKAKQPTSAAHLWQLLQESWAGLSSVYFQSLMERMLRILESKVLEVFLCFFISFVFNVAQEDLYLV